MDFITLGENSQILIIRKKPFKFETGVLKSKTVKHPNLYIPNDVQKADVVITVNGNDEILPNVPNGVEVVEHNNCYYSTTEEGAQQVISNLIQIGKNGIAEQAYYESLVTEGEKAMEKINPQYAEGRQQARTIKDLQERADKQDKKLDDIYALLQKMSGGSQPKTQ